MADRWRLESVLVEAAHYVRGSMLASRRLRGRERRETSVTDDLIVRLTMRGAGQVVAADSPGPESRYGADLELWLRGGGVLLGLRLQAKSLAPRKRKLGVYEHLHHVVRRRSRNAGSFTFIPQVKVLMDGTPRHLNAGYLMYNALERKPSVESACCSFNGYGKKHGRLGLTYTSAETIAELGHLNPQPKSIVDVLPSSVPLQCLVLCPRSPWWDSAAGPAPIPLQASRFPIALAGGPPPVLVRDPTSESEVDINSVAEYFAGRIDEEATAPDHVISLIRTGTIGDEARPSARRVLLLSEDPIGGAR